VRGTGGDDPPAGQVPPLHLPVPQARVPWVCELGVGALPVPDLPAGVPGVAQDRRHCAEGPRRARAVRVPARVSRRRARHARLVQRPGDPRPAVPRQPLGEHPRHHVRRAGVGLQAVRPPAPGGVRLVRVRPRISQPVPVWRAAAEVAALVSGLGGHRGADPDAGAGDLPLRRQPQHRHGLLVVLRSVVDLAACLGQPQLDLVVLEQRGHGRVLGAVEGTLVLPDHDRVPAAARVRERGGQGGRLRAAPPRQHPALPDVEELRHDGPVPADQRLRLPPLPRSRRHRILPVLGRHPPVKREPQPAAARRPGRPAPGPLRPRQQAHDTWLPSRRWPCAPCRHNAARSSLSDRAHPESGPHMSRNTRRKPDACAGRPKAAPVRVRGLAQSGSSDGAAAFHHQDIAPAAVRQPHRPDEDPAGTAGRTARMTAVWAARLRAAGPGDAEAAAQQIPSSGSTSPIPPTTCSH
jgi:hypothetical protein